MDKEYTECEKIIKSPNDSREYSLIQLVNKMHVLLISDPRTPKSANCIKVSVGSLEDPKDFPGLAHFQEHMMFLGSEKYQDPHEYNTFFINNGGDNDASTDDLETCFMFQTSNSGFNEAMDRTVAFFTSPLFLEKYAFKEIQAVNSEFQSSLTDEKDKLEQVLRDFSNQDSFYNRFTCGNKQTLKKKNIRQAQLDFHKKYYSANLMFAVCLSNDSIENLRTNAVKIYSKIKNFDIEKPIYKNYVAPFGESQKMKLIKMDGESDCLHMYFVLPYYPIDQDGSLEYIIRLISNQSKGGIYFSLYNDNLISEIDSDFISIADNQIQFHIEMDLSENGLEKYMTVAGHVIRYINVLKTMEPCKRFYDEIIQNCQIEFRYLESKQPLSYVEAIGENFGYLKNENILYNEFYISPFDEKLIAEQIGYLTPDNCFMVLVSSTHTFTRKLMKKSSHYKTNHSVQDFSNSQLEILKNPPEDYSFSVPCPNFFIPKNFEILGKSGIGSKVPVKILDNEGCVVWHKLDTVFQVPRVIVWFKVYKKSDFEEISPINQIYGKIWGQLLIQTMMHEIKLAESASLDMDLEVNEEFIYQKIDCYSDSLAQIIKLIKEKLFQYRDHPNDSLFENIKESVISELEIETDDAEEMADSYLLTILSKGKIADHIIANSVNKINYIGFKQYCQKEIYQSLYFESYFSGNIDKETCLSINHQLINAFKTYMDYKVLPFSEIKKNLVAKFEPNSLYIYKRIMTDITENSKDSAINTYYQSPYNDCENYWKHNAMFLWLDNWLKESFFNKLRSEEQLGYNVSCSTYEVTGRFGYSFWVKGDKEEPNYVSGRIEEFLKIMKGELDAMAEKEFAEMCQVVIEGSCSVALKLKKDTKLIWSQQIQTHFYKFDYKEILASELGNMNQADIVDLWEKMFVTQRRVLEVHIVNKAVKGAHNKAFKKRKCNRLSSIQIFHGEMDTYKDLYLVKN